MQRNSIKYYLVFHSIYIYANQYEIIILSPHHDNLNRIIYKIFIFFKRIARTNFTLKHLSFYKLNLTKYAFMIIMNNIINYLIIIFMKLMIKKE